MENERWDDDEPLLEGIERLPREGFAAASPSPEFRERVLRRSIAAVRWRVRRPMILGVAAVILAYVAGIGTVHLIGGPAGEQLKAVPESAASPPAQPAASLKLPVSDALLAALPSNPARIKGRIFDASPAEQRRILRKAGDRYLSEYLDIGGALYCYRELLEREDPAARAASDPNDSWLLLSLKEARRKEVTHDTTDG
jgi:hypothetical protein